MDKNVGSVNWMDDVATDATGSIINDLEKGQAVHDTPEAVEEIAAGESEPDFKEQGPDDIEAAKEQDSEDGPEEEKKDEEDDNPGLEQQSSSFDITHGSPTWDTHRVSSGDISPDSVISSQPEPVSNFSVESDMSEQQGLDPDKNTLLQGDSRNSASAEEINEEQKNKSTEDKEQQRREAPVNADRSNQAAMSASAMPGTQMSAGIAGALGSAVGKTGGALFSGLKDGYKYGLGTASKQLENLDGFRAKRQKEQNFSGSAELNSCREELKGSIDAAIDDARKEVSSERMGNHVNAISGNLEKYQAQIQQRAEEIEEKQGPDAAVEFMKEQKKELKEDQKTLGEELKEYPEQSAKLQEFFAAVLNQCKKFINTVLEKIGLKSAPAAEAQYQEQDMAPSMGPR